jgi:hypothetical protein
LAKEVQLEFLITEDAGLFHGNNGFLVACLASEGARSGGQDRSEPGDDVFFHDWVVWLFAASMR